MHDQMTPECGRCEQPHRHLHHDPYTGRCLLCDCARFERAGDQRGGGRRG